MESGMTRPQEQLSLFESETRSAADSLAGSEPTVALRGTGGLRLVFASDRGSNIGSLGSMPSNHHGSIDARLLRRVRLF